MDIELPQDAFDSADFHDLEVRLGRDSALEVLRTLERFEGIPNAAIDKLSPEERMDNVLRIMMENLQYQTRH